MPTFCTVCGEYIHRDYVIRGEGRPKNRHVCPPRFFVEHEEVNGDQTVPVRARSAEDAALKYARRYDDHDGDLVGGDDQRITVYPGRDKTGGRVFVISAEREVVYQTREVKP